ncbi:hypothetical protein [Thetidibacter halocola]|uniref:Uncharacterized protein n=1 Tax=Thetidibacter halocola TaxID=2827239 RepID=A0A8J7W949_9RHOB|nr:hypothetical protein [Thetidibacter halocola]MBS0122502.1 hypothetical protein [Thetidibacter halocola]
MCKNADKPCPGCTKHTTADSAWMFFTDEDRAALTRPDRTAERPGAVSHS